MPLPLGKLVLLSSVVASGSCTLIYYLIRKAFSRASYYQLALEQLHSYPEALAALGPPLLSISSTSPTSTASWTLPMPRYWTPGTAFRKAVWLCSCAAVRV
ncbi:cytochrome c oxidase assembly factor 1 homolog isoform X2 [Herpailurus yagouaroundi]|uniref:cytochrome c oxidase assembly factor 1 homolog isoform X2 n=1 Tax=Herpailurus yagouaroundi TaxID=1608482 RepID=UPI001AD624E2|nr:cytochrome c oxidase assembly factor 1 homolog isoform X2 [Puma yagouaroundi]